MRSSRGPFGPLYAHRVAEIHSLRPFLDKAIPILAVLSVMSLQGAPAWFCACTLNFIRAYKIH